MEVTPLTTTAVCDHANMCKEGTPKCIKDAGDVESEMGRLFAVNELDLMCQREPFVFSDVISAFDIAE